MSTNSRLLATIMPADENGEPIEPVDENRIMLEYQFPMVDTSSNSRTVKHEPIGEPTVVDHMGDSAQEITVQGHCYRDEANQIDNLTEDGRIIIITDRWRGTAIVDQAETSATGAGGGHRNGVEQNRLFDYRLNLLEIEGRAPIG